VQEGCIKMPVLKTLFGDGARSEPCAQALQAAYGLDVLMVHHPGSGNAHVFDDTHGAQASSMALNDFAPLPMRGVVERTQAWTQRCCRLVAPVIASSLPVIDFGMVGQGAIP
jgi:putative transposase